ncbi:MAG TPA: efflux RND transporter periplasmic adaptor subunit [Candidatus Binataceae bacterium]|nr:efflux RND transporter periplasmic adaptor subunit [Candidatus Binataceae bacterium]
MAGGAKREPNLVDIDSLRIDRSSPPRARPRYLRFIAGLAVALLLAIAGEVVYSRTLGRPLTVQTAVAIARGGAPAILLTGSGYVVTQHKYIVVGTKILGQIVEEPIEEGQHVRRGDLLARIDDRDYQAQLRQAIADRDLAAADVRLKRAQAARLRTLYRNQVASRDQLDVADNALAVAQAQLQKAEAAIDYARFNVSQCVITSPIDGIVLTKYRELGDTINYGGDIQAGGGTTDIVQLADTTDMRTEVDINESDIAKVVMGGPATVTPDAYPDQSFAATVAKIYPAADRQKGTVKVEVKLTHPDLRIIKPEMSAKVAFLADEPPPASAATVVVPRKALVTDPSGSAVWTVSQGLAHRRVVTPGRELEDGVEIARGLDGGELVILDPPAGLREGARVTPTP